MKPKVQPKEQPTMTLYIDHSQGAQAIKESIHKVDGFTTTLDRNALYKAPDKVQVLFAENAQVAQSDFKISPDFTYGEEDPKYNNLPRVYIFCPTYEEAERILKTVYAAADEILKELP